MPPSFEAEAVRPFSFVRRKQLGAAFDLFNPRVLDAVDEATMKFCRETNAVATSDLKDAIKKLRRLLKRGLSRGDAFAVLSRQVRRIFADPVRAYRIAVTESVRALQHGTLMNARESGVVSKKSWLASSAACDECAKLEDKGEIDLDEPFVDGRGPYGRVMAPPLHPHCLLPETPVLAPETVRAMKAYFRGACVSIKFVGGNRLACTPNHMFLTPRGLVRAKFLVQGDDVLCCPEADWMLRGGPDDYRGPSGISEVFDSLGVTGRVPSASVPVAPEYLHGDGASCQGYVDVVRADRLLQDVSQPWEDMEESAEQSFFEDAGFGVGLVGGGDFAAVLEGVLAPSDRSVGRPCQSLLVFSAHRFHPDLLGFAHPSGIDSGLDDPPANDLPADVQRLGDCLLRLSACVSTDDAFHVQADEFGQSDGLFPGSQRNTAFSEPVLDSVPADAERIRYAVQGLSGLVTACKIADVGRFHYDGSVYDLETESHLYYTIGGVLSSNCLCSLQEVL